MMKLDNSKRMEALKGFLKEEKKKKKEKTTSFSRSKASSAMSTVSSSSSKGSGSKISKGSSSRRLRRTESNHEPTRHLGRTFSSELPIVESSMEFVSPKNALNLQQSWDSIRQDVDGYELRVGEELFMSMMEINPSIRQATGISSLRSAEFDALCKRITGHIDFMVGMAGPANSQEFDLLDIGVELKKDGICPALLADAVPQAMKQVIGAGKFTNEVADAWSYFFVKHIHLMTKE